MLDPPPAAAALWSCRHCRLGFRWPRPSAQELVELYRTGAPDSWSEAGSRVDWQQAATWLAAELPGQGNVLDVGCFDGGFLALLPARLRRFGVEPHPAAADRATRTHGVEVVAGSYEDLGPQVFDAVVAFDVIEHVLDPQHLLAVLASRVRPGGALVLATGDLDAPSRRLMGSRYWYCWFAEHVSFVSPRWFALAAPDAGLRVERTVRFSHGDRRPARRAAETVKNLGYRVAPALADRARRPAAGDPAAGAPPSWSSARDHVLVLLRRDHAPAS